jgi:hypothetical protein
MKLQLTLLILVSQAVSAFSQLRENTFIVTSEEPNRLVLAIGSAYPLRDALEYLNHEYGWRVSYEDPLYPNSELTDYAIPEWKKKHPGERGFYAPKHTEMRFRVTKPTGSKGERNRILTELLEQFNGSGREEKFKLIDASHERQVVVGTIHGQGALDLATIGPEPTARNGSIELSRLTKTCSQKMPLPMVGGTFSANMLASITVPPRKSLVSCRDAILALTEQEGDDIVYFMNEDVNGKAFVMNIVPNRIVIAQPT